MNILNDIRLKERSFKLGNKWIAFNIATFCKQLRMFFYVGRYGWWGKNSIVLSFEINLGYRDKEIKETIMGK